MSPGEKMIYEDQRSRLKLAQVLQGRNLPELQKVDEIEENENLTVSLKKIPSLRILKE